MNSVHTQILHFGPYRILVKLETEMVQKWHHGYDGANSV